MSNFKLFDVQHSNVESQNDMNVEHQTVDVQHCNVECQTTNVKPTLLPIYILIVGYALESRAFPGFYFSGPKARGP